MTPDLQKFIDASRAICDAATEGPWHTPKPEEFPWRCNAPSDCGPTATIIGKGGFGVMSIPTIHGPVERDIRFIAHARTALPAALDHLHAALKENDELRAKIVELQDDARNPPRLRTRCEAVILEGEKRDQRIDKQPETGDVIQ